MIDTILLKLAIGWGEWNTVFHLFDGLIGEAVEGEIESSRIKFNEIWKSLPNDKAYQFAKQSIFNDISFLAKYIARYEERLVEMQEGLDNQ